MTSFAGFGSWGKLISNVSKCLKAGRLGGWKASQHPGLFASQHAEQLIFERFGLVDQHYRDIIPNFIA
jgi:hypothetical protein